MAIRNRLSLLFGVVLCLSVSNAFAAELDVQKEALNVIADFADRICEKTPLVGGAENLELSGDAKIELNNLLKKIADLGIKGAAKYQKSEYQGVLQKDLVTLIRGGRECKLKVWEDLKDKLIVSGRLIPEVPKPRPESEDGRIANLYSKYGMNLEESLEGDKILHYRIREITKDSITLEVDYTYNAIHGREVYVGGGLWPVGAEPNGVPTSFFPSRAPSYQKGTAILKISVRLNELSERRWSEELEINLYEAGKGPFVVKLFPYRRLWGQ